ncbi:MAG: prepilin-type N-terminal cleavage/methylation domain-containing protein [Nitrospirae bacterium]|nr:prepilin-type N-terminal cleavage/methylation domain-containing protein [Nitrospirota bacterium]
MNSREAGAGFTLIEVLISLTLLVIVLGAVYGSFFSVRRVLDRFDDVSVKYHEARTALDIMRREVEGALLKNAGGGQADTRVEIANSTAFVIKDRDVLGKSASEMSLTALSFRGSSVNALSYYVEEKDDKLILLKKEAPHGVRSGEYSTGVIEGIEGFSVETFFRDRWVRTWDTADTGKLPEVVRVSISFEDNGRTVKLTEYARPRVGGKL